MFLKFMMALLFALVLTIGLAVGCIPESTKVIKTNSADYRLSGGPRETTVFGWSTGTTNVSDLNSELIFHAVNPQVPFSSITELSVGPISLIGEFGEQLVQIPRSGYSVNRNEFGIEIRMEAKKEFLTSMRKVSILTSCRFDDSRSLERSPQYRSWYSVIEFVNE